MTLEPSACISSLTVRRLTCSDVFLWADSLSHTHELLAKQVQKLECMSFRLVLMSLRWFFFSFYWYCLCKKSIKDTIFYDMRTFFRWATWHSGAFSALLVNQCVCFCITMMWWIEMVVQVKLHRGSFCWTRLASEWVLQLWTVQVVSYAYKSTGIPAVLLICWNGENSVLNLTKGNWTELLLCIYYISFI